MYILSIYLRVHTQGKYSTGLLTSTIFLNIPCLNPATSPLNTTCRTTVYTATYARNGGLSWLSICFSVRSQFGEGNLVNPGHNLFPLLAFLRFLTLVQRIFIYGCLFFNTHLPTHTLNRVWRPSGPYGSGICTKGATPTLKRLVQSFYSVPAAEAGRLSDKDLWK